MAAKPIVDIVHRGRRIVIDFDKAHNLALKYAIAVDGKRHAASYFAEEVMRWMAEQMHEEPKAP